MNKIKYKVIDNFLPVLEFDVLQDSILNPKNDFNWYFMNHISIAEELKDEFFFAHMIFSNSEIITANTTWSLMQVLFEKLKIKALIRAKINCYTRTEKILEHSLHKDLPFKHKGCVFYLNTNDGYTLLEDGTKIKSIANRVLLFNPNDLHASTSTSDTNRRVTININWF
tara:strand:- start:70 stop:576 length:507 start_codon:yes stop_codon:yes gene_type:complete